MTSKGRAIDKLSRSKALVMALFHNFQSPYDFLLVVHCKFMAISAASDTLAFYCVSAQCHGLQQRLL